MLGALKAQVVTFGEAMLRLSPPGRLRLEQARTLEVWPAGAELNVAVGLARLGEDVAWVSRLPASPLGEIVLAHARSFGIDVSGVLRAEEGRLGLYFVEVSEPPLASRALYDRSASAFALLDPGELDWAALLAGARAFHVTGITAALSDGCARAAADALRAARAAGCATSYDLNLRTRLAPPGDWRARLEEVAPSLDTLVCSCEDAAAVLGVEGPPADVAGRLRDLLGIERVVASRRVADGAALRRESAAVDGDGSVEATSPPFRASEPVGAGDAFCAGLLSGLLAGDLARGLELGGAMAAVKQAVPGDAPVVGLEELELALAEDPEDAPVSRGWRLVRVDGPDGRRFGAVAPDQPDRIVLVGGSDPLHLLAPGALAKHAAASAEAIEGVEPETLRPPAPWRLSLPLDPGEVWCAGVTYERSRDARLEESQTEARDAYSLVYDAERPELFLKDAAGRRTVGPGGLIGVRSDSSWTVPEPELGIVLGEGGSLLGLTAGNDVSSRDIEGANPLYLPQAKVYAGACALGPAVLVPDSWEEPFPIELRVRDAAGDTIFAGETSTARLKRGLAELAGFCVRDNPVPPGSVLLTGTGLVPEDDFTLEPGMVVEVGIDGIGRLVNTVAIASDLL